MVPQEVCQGASKAIGVSTNVNGSKFNLKESYRRQKKQQALHVMGRGMQLAYLPEHYYVIPFISALRNEGTEVVLDYLCPRCQTRWQRWGETGLRIF
jgi:hypothetical protein